MLRLNSRVAIAALAALAAGACFAQAEKPAPLTGEAAAIKKNLEQKFPGAEVRGVSKTQYFGLYEVQLDDRILYTDAKSKYIMIGAMYDTDAKVNLTEERQRKLNRVNVATLPLDMAIKKVKGNGSRRLAIFSDAVRPRQARRWGIRLHDRVRRRRPPLAGSPSVCPLACSRSRGRQGRASPQRVPT